MRSHDYEITCRQFGAFAAPLGAAALALALGLHGLAALGWLPALATGHLPDVTVLGYQARAARAPDAAAVVFIGDSACLTGVDTRELGRLLPGQPKARNLGLVAGISLAAYGDAAKQFIAANPGQVRAVVVLLSPGKLTGRFDSADFETLWRELAAGQPPTSLAALSHARWRHWTGVALLQDRLLAHVLVAPLRQGAGERFGFPAGIRRHLAAHDGSAVDTRELTRPPRRSPADLVIGPEVAAQSRALRQGLPPGVRLFAGFTPIPEGLPEPGYRAARDATLREWGALLGADELLLDLPATLPDGLFASGVHLNERGQRHFTRVLAASLARRLPPPAPPAR